MEHVGAGQAVYWRLLGITFHVITPRAGREPHPPDVDTIA